MPKKPNRWIPILILITLLFCLFSVVSFSETGERNVSARSFVLFEPTEKVILQSKNENVRMPMASTTKIMTAYLAVLSPKIEETVTVSDSATGIEGSSLYLKAGESFTLKELTYALMLRSANDAAIAIAEAVSGSVDDFVALMNQKAEELGLTDTHFDNPNGLDSDTHYTTAKDLAALTAEALKEPLFAKIVSTKKMTIGEGDSTRILLNHNRLLSAYDGCLGVKTGYTKKDGRCLVSYAERDGVSLIAVTLDAPDDWADHKYLLDCGFSLLERRTAVTPREYRYSLPVLCGTSDTVTVTNAEGFSEIVQRTEADETVTVSVSRFLVAPISAGEQLGTVTVRRGDKILAKIPLIATEDVAYSKHKK